MRDPNRCQPGGLSGRPILPRTLELVRMLRRVVPRDWVLVGVGGVFDAEDAWRLLRALGWTPQRPASRALERNQAAIRRWKQVRWPELKKTPKDRGKRSSSSTKAG